MVKDSIFIVMEIVMMGIGRMEKWKVKEFLFFKMEMCMMVNANKERKMVLGHIILLEVIDIREIGKMVLNMVKELIIM